LIEQNDETKTNLNISYTESLDNNYRTRIIALHIRICLYV